MPFMNGAEHGPERHAAGDGLSQTTEADDVTITIRGLTAARMLGRADAEKRIIEELVALRQRLDGMEAAAAQRATQHEDLSRAVQGLQEKAELMNRQVAVQAAELDRLRNDLDGQSFRAAPLPGKVDQVQGQVDLLERQINPLIGQLDQMQAQIQGLERALAPKPSATDSGEASAPNGWFRQRLNGSFWFW